MKDSMNIVVLAGGVSTERDVSLVSGGKIYKALRESGHKPLLLDVYMGLEDNDLDTVFERGDELLGKAGVIGLSAPDIEEIRAQRGENNRTFWGKNVLEICSRADVVFMALHGQNGENGRVQAAFDLFGIKYTGADFLSSAICMDKSITKELLERYGINVPKGYRLSKGEPDEHDYSYPVVVKVTDGGSSVGVYIAHNKEECLEAKRKAFLYGNEIIVEEYIRGREFSVGVVEGDALPIIEINTGTGFYDYIKKYQEGSAIETCPAELNKADTEKMIELAEQVYKILRLSQYARIDIIMDKNGKMYVLEANTLPGMTPTSLMPQEAAALGISYNQFCGKLVEMALKKE